MPMLQTNPVSMDISYLTTFTLTSAVKTGSKVGNACTPTVVQISYYIVHLLSQPLSSFII
jgi:hypothetical protein